MSVLTPWDVSWLADVDPLRCGLAVNASAPPDVLIRLAGDADVGPALEFRSHLLREPMLDEVARILTRHPDPGLRSEIAGNPFVANGIRAGLMADVDSRVRAAAAGNSLSLRGPRGGMWFPRVVSQPLPAAAYQALATDPEPSVRRAVAFNLRLPTELRVALTNDPHADVREAAARGGPLPTEVLGRLLSGSDRHAVQGFRQWVNYNLGAAAVPAELLGDFRPDPGRWEAAMIVKLTPELLTELLAKPHAHKWLVLNPSLPPEAMESLADHDSDDVLRRLLLRPDLPQHLYQRIVFDPDGRSLILWLLPEHAPLETRLRYVDSPKRLFRRTVAVGPDLPVDAVHRLARDPDFSVRLLLCEYHPEAPAETLVEVAAKWNRWSKTHLVRRKNFPPEVHEAYARSTDDHERLCVADLPTLPLDLARTLVTDRSEQVRYTAAANPLLPVELLHRLLTHADPRIRVGAARNPSLPYGYMTRLLHRWGF